ncbi:MAG: PAS domain S-box protein [Spirochaetes bacterium]|nr:MAG: PAS domain S-box protein [Spirochaetota bacterium]
MLDRSTHPTPAKILVVEDEQIIAQFVTEALERLGYLPVGSVDNGEAAIAAARDRRPDIILMDIRLRGGMDGIEAARRIRAERDVPIIYVTSNADQDTVEAARDTEPSGYLNKPINERDLLTNVDSALYKHSMERRLRESEEKYRNLLANINDIIYSLDAEGAITFMSPPFILLSGYAPEEVTGRPLADFVHADDAAALNAAWRGEKVGDTVSAEFRMITGSGRAVWVRTSARRVLEEGRYAGLNGVLTDIDARKRAEMELEKFKFMVEGAGEEIYLAHPDGSLAYVNEAAARSLGYAGEEMLGMGFRGFDPAFGENYSGHFLELKRGGVPPFETVHRTRDGRAVVKEMRSVYLKIGEDEYACGFGHDITPRKRIEEKLRESERRYRFFLDNFPGIAYQFYVDNGEMLFIHGAIERITGYTGEDFLAGAVSHAAIVHPDDAARVEAERQALYGASGYASFIEYRITRRDGGLRWVLHSALNFSDAGARPFVQGVIYDITERREYAMLLESVFREMPVSIGITEASNGKFVMVNEEFLRVSGYAREEVIGRTTADLGLYFGQSDRESIRGIALSGREDHVVEVRLKGRDGRSMTGLMTATSIVLGGRTCILAVVQDISERRKAQEALAGEKERLMVTLRSIGDGVITTDTEGRVTLMNRVAEELTAWPIEEALDRPLGEVFRLRDRGNREEFPSPVETVIRTGGITGREADALLVSKTGREMIIANSGAPIRDRESNIIGVVLVFRDITERERIEEGLRNAQKLESIGMLAGGIAHDFNNLLTGIFGYLELARDSLASAEEAAGYLASALSVFNRARDLTQQLLTFSKDIKPIRTPSSIGTLVRKSVGFALSGSKINARFTISEKLWGCAVDESQVGQVIDNIVINAQQAMPEGGTITVSADNVALPRGGRIPLPPGRYVRIVIGDQGIGIPRDLLSKIFDPFFTTKQKGSGLGLATSYSIIRKHDGHIEASSEPGKGSSFSIYLPAIAEDAGVQRSQGLDDYRGTGRVLLMDDEGFIKDVAGRMLKHLGYSVETAQEGSVAVKLFREALERGEPFDAVILDLTVPGGMGGVETIKNIREIHPGARAIASSGYSVDPVMAHPDDYGFSGTLIKPFKIEELGKALKEMLAKSS